MFDKTVSEHQRQTLIQKYVNTRTGCYVWRNNAGKVQTMRGDWIQLADKGTPDLVGFTPEGKFLGIEIKKAGKKLEPEQVIFAKKLRATGGVYITAREVEDIQEKLQGIKHEPLPF